ncbi:MAG: hypothetical protein AAB555_01835 [Patescibacteria group bacterium]
MPKITRVYGGNQDELPLRVTHRKGNKKKAPSIRAKCPCCAEAVVIFPESRPTGNPQIDSVEINGVHASVAQWRELLLPILGIGSIQTLTIRGIGMNKLHTHPVGAGKNLFGRRLKIGEVLQKIDRLDSPSGDWESIPGTLVGKTIKNNLKIYIRPAAI